MTRYVQLGLFDWSEVPTLEWTLEQENFSWVQRRAELSLGFSSQWLGWFGMLLLGRWDSRICPNGLWLTSFAVVKMYPGWVCSLRALDSEGGQWKAIVKDVERDKLLMSVRAAIRNGELEWKLEKPRRVDRRGSGW